MHFPCCCRLGPLGEWRRFFQRSDRLLIPALQEYIATQIGVPSKVVRGQRDYFLEHLGGIIVLALAVIEDSEPTVSGPVLWPQAIAFL